MTFCNLVDKSHANVKKRPSQKRITSVRNSMKDQKILKKKKTVETVFLVEARRFSAQPNISTSYAWQASLPIFGRDMRTCVAMQPSASWHTALAKK